MSESYLLRLMAYALQAWLLSVSAWILILEMLNKIRTAKAARTEGCPEELCRRAART
jgi:hypothetical protein